MQVFLPREPVEARAVKVGGRVGEVEVAAVVEARSIALAAQRAGDRGEPLALDGQLHDRHLGLGGKSAQHGYRAAVGAERVGEEVVEIDSLALQPLEFGSYGFASDTLVDRRAAEAFDQEQHDVRPSGAQQRVGSDPGRQVAAQRLEDRRTLRFGEEFVFVEGVVAVRQGREEREKRIDRRMVQEHPTAEIDLRDIGRCHRYPAADRQEEHSCRQQQHQRAACAMCRPPGGVVKPQYAQVAPRHASEDRRGDQQLQQELAGRDARQRLFGRGEVLQHGAVEREGPVFVEGEVGGERRGGDGGDDEQVAFQHAAAPSPRNPEGCEHDQERQCGDVSRYGLVEFQSVPDDQRQLCGRSFGRLRVVPQQEERFLDRHHEQAHGEEGAEKEQVAGQRRKGPAGGVR